jgi:hypothetical protein
MWFCRSSQTQNHLKTIFSPNNTQVHVSFVELHLKWIELIFWSMPGGKSKRNVFIVVSSRCCCFTHIPFDSSSIIVHTKLSDGWQSISSRQQDLYCDELILGWLFPKGQLALWADTNPVFAPNKFFSMFPTEVRHQHNSHSFRSNVTTWHCHPTRFFKLIIFVITCTEMDC